MLLAARRKIAFNQTGTPFRLGAARLTGRVGAGRAIKDSPQAPQNRRPLGLSNPQAGHWTVAGPGTAIGWGLAGTSEAPQAPQNRKPVGLSNPQAGHLTVTGLGSGAGWGLGAAGFGVGGVKEAPQAPQNRKFLGLSNPHAGHLTVTGLGIGAGWGLGAAGLGSGGATLRAEVTRVAPHSSQNFIPPRLENPQTGQVSSTAALRELPDADST
jgi:hypothetical protein